MKNACADFVNVLILPSQVYSFIQRLSDSSNFYLENKVIHFVRKLKSLGEEYQEKVSLCKENNREVHSCVRTQN